ncbi:MAG: phage terminase large subunit [Muribaculaceae bacterium]|nr:phage terminase large subunit [Muribaculaceae bacterium]
MGGKSYVGSTWICSLCIRFEDIRCVIARKTIKSLKESTFNTVKMILRRWGLIEKVNYKINNLEGYLIFWNGSIIYLKELDDAPSDPSFERLGSTEITAAFVDEVSEISEKAIEVLMSRCRWKVADYMGWPRILMTTNPCATWVRSRFVQDDEGNPVALNRNDHFVRFSVYDNPDEEFVRVYEANLRAMTDPAERARLLYGNWDYVDDNKNAAYWNFKGNIHLVDNLRETVYDPLKPLILSFDFNVVPYMTSLAFQVDYEKKELYVLEEILGRPEDKENNTPKLADKVSNKYLSERHMGGLVITGDPAGLQRSTQTEDGVNNYSILLQHIHPSLHAYKNIFPKQPPQAPRLNFINKVLEGKTEWKIKADMRCRRLTEDFIYQRKNEDGTKEKKKITDPNLGVKYEKYGHCSDAFDYGVCLLLGDQWKKFQNGNGTRKIHTVNKPVYKTFDY